MESRATILSTTDHRRDWAGLRYVYPVLSRRAGGVSVGINLNPNNACNWQCVYCQVPNLQRGSAPAIDCEVLAHELRSLLAAMVEGDYLTQHAPEGMRSLSDLAFSGNGEPTTAAEFAQIVELVCSIRNQFKLNQLPIRLITNGSLLHRASVQAGIAQLGHAGGEVWFKLDAGTTQAIQAINGVPYTPERAVENLQRCVALAPTWIQTCAFARNGVASSTTDWQAYLDLLNQVGVTRLQGVLLYGVARPSMQAQASEISGLSTTQLDAIATQLRQAGLTVRVAY